VREVLGYCIFEAGDETEEDMFLRPWKGRNISVASVKRLLRIFA
jgi:hypothetical protein